MKGNLIRKGAISMVILMTILSLNVVPSLGAILKEANWVNGMAFGTDSPNNYIWNTYGWGKQYTPATTVCSFAGCNGWFYVPVPTTVISDGNRNQISTAYVLFKTTGMAKIKYVDIYDGPNSMYRFTGDRSGDHGSNIDSVNTFTLPTPISVNYGIGIWVYVDFGLAIDGPSGGSILFTTAGADFYQ